MLTHGQIRELLSETEFRGKYVVKLVKRNNHVYRIIIDDIAYYLKIYTKDWYGSDIHATGYCVDHEVAAWRKLSEFSLRTPNVLVADTTPNNLLGRPFLITRGLCGNSLTTLIRRARVADRQDLMLAVGRYLAGMHQIAFDFPGFVTSDGPNAPPSDNQWQHSSWTFEQFSRDACQIWEGDREQAPETVMKLVDGFYTRHAPSLALVYSKPRFVHGDCHAKQFYMVLENGRWRVSGVVDMEVASAGDSGSDFVKFSIEMAAVLPARTRWWQLLFEGYGEEPSFELLKLRMLAAQHADYSWCWPGTRTDILQHILSANNWSDLFDLSRLKQTA